MKLNKIILTQNTITPIDNTIYNTIYNTILTNNINATGRLINGSNLYGIYLWKIIK